MFKKTRFKKHFAHMYHEKNMSRWKRVDLENSVINIDAKKYQYCITVGSIIKGREVRSMASYYNPENGRNIIVIFFKDDEYYVMNNDDRVSVAFPDLMRPEYI